MWRVVDGDIDDSQMTHTFAPICFQLKQTFFVRKFNMQCCCVPKLNGGCKYAFRSSKMTKFVLTSIGFNKPPFFRSFTCALSQPVGFILTFPQ